MCGHVTWSSIGLVILATIGFAGPKDSVKWVILVWSDKQKKREIGPEYDIFCASLFGVKQQQPFEAASFLGNLAEVNCSGCGFRRCEMKDLGSEDVRA